MPMATSLRASAVLATCALLTACAGTEEGVSSHDNDCTSHYEPVASAESWSDLRVAMLANRDWGRVASVRTQARRQEAATGPGDQAVVRVVDLLDRKRRRLIQVDVWRTERVWRAGAWSQCID